MYYNSLENATINEKKKYLSCFSYKDTDLYIRLSLDRDLCKIKMSKLGLFLVPNKIKWDRFINFIGTLPSYLLFHF